MRFFFEPKSVAVIGASSNPSKGGYGIVQNLLSSYDGTVYPINPKGGEILGLDSYTSVLDIPGQVDLAVVLVPAREVTQAVRECVEKGIPGVVIESAGFAEIGGEGKRLQDEIVRIAASKGVRLWGPNCTGIVNVERGLVTSFIVRNLKDLRPGNVSFVSQSGMMAGAVFIQIVTSDLFGVSKACAIGNKCDVDESDILEYLGRDAATEVIAMYLESIKDGRRFLQVAADACRRKPLIILKSGRTALGAKASASHTGSMAGDDRIIDGALRQLGVVRATDFMEMLDLAKGFSRVPFLRAGPRIGAITITGGGGVVAADLLVDSGLHLPAFGVETEDELRRIFPPWAPLGNPLDAWPAREKHDVETILSASANALLADQGIDCLLLLLLGYEGIGSIDWARLTGEWRRHGKPILAWIGGHQRYLQEWTVELEHGGIPAYRDIRTPVKVFEAMSDYMRWRQRSAVVGA